LDSLIDKIDSIIPSTVIQDEAFYFDTKKTGKRGPILISQSVSSGKVAEIAATGTELQRLQNILDYATLQSHHHFQIFCEDEAFYHISSNDKFDPHQEQNPVDHTSRPYSLSQNAFCFTPSLLTSAGNYQPEGSFQGQKSDYRLHLVLLFLRRNSRLCQRWATCHMYHGM